MPNALSGRAVYIIFAYVETSSGFKVGPTKSSSLIKECHRIKWDTNGKKMFNKNIFLCVVSCFAFGPVCAWISSVARSPAFFFFVLFFFFRFHELYSCFLFFLRVFFSSRKCLSFKCMECCVQTNFRKVSRIFHSFRRVFFLLLLLSSSSSLESSDSGACCRHSVRCVASLK